MDAGRNAADLLGMVESGEKRYFSSSYLAGRVPEFALLDLPFVVDDRAAAYAALDGALGALLAERLERSSSYRLLGFTAFAITAFGRCPRTAPAWSSGRCSAICIEIRSGIWVSVLVRST